MISGDVVIIRIYGDRDIIRMIDFGHDEDKVRLIPFNQKYPVLEISKTDIDYMWKIVEKCGRPVKM